MRVNQLPVRLIVGSIEINSRKKKNDRIFGANYSGLVAATSSLVRALSGTPHAVPGNTPLGRLIGTRALLPLVLLLLVSERLLITRRGATTNSTKKANRLKLRREFTQSRRSS